MERKKYTGLTLLFLLATNVWAGNKEKIYEAYISGNMLNWKNTIDQMQQQKNQSAAFLAELVNFQYGYIGWCVGADQKNEAENYIHLAEKNLEKLLDMHFSEAEINAYKSAIYGFKIGLSPLKAPVFGPRSIKLSKLAIEQAPANPLGYIQYGNAQFYMPSAFGGSKSEAVQYFEKALQLMEKKDNQIQNNWNYLSLLTLLAQSYETMGKYNEAGFYYEKALKTEPLFHYIREELYPEFLKKKNNNE